MFCLTLSALLWLLIWSCFLLLHVIFRIRFPSLLIGISFCEQYILRFSWCRLNFWFEGIFIHDRFSSRVVSYIVVLNIAVQKKTKTKKHYPNPAPIIVPHTVLCNIYVSILQSSSVVSFFTRILPNHDLYFETYQNCWTKSV